jgi:hypothetical protein
VANSDIVRALGWQAGDKHEVVPALGGIVILASPDGLFCAPSKPGILILAAARPRHDIGSGDHVLLAAAPEFGVVIVHTRQAMNEMLAATTPRSRHRTGISMNDYPRPAGIERPAYCWKGWASPPPICSTHPRLSAVALAYGVGDGRIASHPRRIDAAEDDCFLIVGVGHRLIQPHLTEPEQAATGYGASSRTVRLS